MEQTILYTLPAAPDATEHKVLRLTVGVVTALGMARYRRLMREATIYVDDMFGPIEDKADGDKSTSEDEEAQPERDELQDACYRRAYMLATLKKVELGTCAPDEKMPTEWKPSELPAEWQTIEGFIDGVPGRLFSTWETVALDCNPDTFYVDLSNEKKRKPGSVIVI